MKDFQLRNDTKLLLLNDPAPTLTSLMSGKKVLFVFGNGSVFENGCYDDVFKSAKVANAEFHELGEASRELADIERGIALCKEHGINLVIGAGGASIMDCAKLIAFGTSHEDDLWEYVKNRKDPHGEEKLPLVLMPTYPSSEMTAYTGLVTLVQLSAATLGDKNPVSYDIGISVIKNVLKAITTLQKEPNDLDARGVILYGASISTSSRLGLGKEANYAYEIYELEFIPEVLFGVPYRRSLTTIFPRFLTAMAPYHQEDIGQFLKDAFGLEGDMKDCEKRLVELFSSFGVPMYFEGEACSAQIADIDITTSLSIGEVTTVINNCLK